jgi:hypothetical protein
MPVTVLRLKERIHAVKRLSEIISGKLAKYENDLKPAFVQACRLNPWFTEQFVKEALQQWAVALEHVETWLKPYGELNPSRPFTVGVINAGNIPFVGMHDLLSVLVSGHNYQGKNATGDNILLPLIAQLLIDAEPAFGERISFTDRLSGIDAVIATGSNNSARYFEYYFGKYPNIIRKNRNGVAILTGNETTEELENLGKDIFMYFGLGCRNVSKLYVPKGYDFTKFFEAIYPFNFVAESNKYINNFEYNNSVLLLKRIPFLQNGFLIVMEDKRIASPISIIHYEHYESVPELVKQLAGEKESLQCIATGSSIYENSHELKNITVGFGETQNPQLWDYADGVDTIRFLSGLK